MTELETWISAYPPPALAQRLLADPAFASFNMLWKSPSSIAPVCNFFGLATMSDALAFAAALLDGSGWVTYRDKLSAWLNPRPGVTLAEVEAVPWADVEPIMAGPLIPKDSTYWVKPTDGTLYLPTPAQLATIIGNCPAKFLPWHKEDNDCDDRAWQFKGWMSSHGLGQCAIAFCCYEPYSGTTLQGGHALGLAICKDRQPYLAEPADGKVYPITQTNLGGFFFANRIAVSLAVF